MERKKKEAEWNRQGNCFWNVIERKMSEFIREGRRDGL